MLGAPAGPNASLNLGFFEVLGRAHRGRFLGLIEIVFVSNVSYFGAGSNTVMYGWRALFEAIFSRFSRFFSRFVFEVFEVCFRGFRGKGDAF